MTLILSGRLVHRSCFAEKPVLLIHDLAGTKTGRYFERSTSWMQI